MRPGLSACLAIKSDESPGRCSPPAAASGSTARPSTPMLDELAGQANVNLPKAEHIRLHPHLLRHTALKEIVKKGRHYAQKMSGNAGLRHIERYLSPLDSDYEQAVEEAAG